MPALKGIAKPLASRVDDTDEDEDEDEEPKEPEPEPSLATVTSNDVGKQTRTKKG